MRAVVWTVVVATAGCGGRESVSVRSAWCSRSAWSCVENRCTWECGGGRTCDRDGAGCTTCSDRPDKRYCPDQQCSVFRPVEGRVESMSCATVPDRTTWAGFGDMARLPDGTLCSIQGLPTGAHRYAVACGECQTVFVQ